MHKPQKALNLFGEGLEILRPLIAREYSPAISLFVLLQRNFTSCLKDIHESHIDLGLTVAETIVAVGRALVGAYPQYRPLLAAALHDLAFAFPARQSSHEPDAAEECISLYQDLANRDCQAYNERYADALYNFSRRLFAIGEYQSALRASLEETQLRRKLRDKEYLASCLDHLSRCLGAAGQIDVALNIAEEAVRIRRKLVEENMTWKFESQLAESLNNLSHCLLLAPNCAQRALSSAREAASIQRGHARDTRAEAFNLRLGVFLHNFSVILSAVGRNEEALRAQEEAVQILTRGGDSSCVQALSLSHLASCLRASFNKRLTDGLQNLAAHALLAGAHDEAFSSAEEAVGITRKLVDINPSQHSPTLVNVLYTYANILCENAEYERSHSVILEAEALRETICSDSIFVSLEASAAYMSTQARCFVGLGRRDDGLRSVMGAIQLYEMDFSSPQKIMFESFPWFLRNIVCCISALGENGVNVAEAKTDVVGLSRMLAGYDPDKYERYLQHVIEL
ncbi:hypothetical protein C8F04DRAFT_1040834 [Mycena alexandri]|uniref:Uncharacterized protein n=1 Tax=Mycena alexandri TaxID=1745969 RepID=A0AAD6SRB8_9AGAR|nr:hypothetical protein C8F04DRAFT_1040834 [Mycena alexandri]